MRHNVGTFLAVLTAPAFVVVLGLVMLTILSITAPIFSAMSPDGPSDVTKDSIEFGAAHTLFTVAGMLSIPAAILLALLVGGRSTNRGEPPRRGPF